MLGTHFVEDSRIIMAEERRAEEGITGLGKLPLSRKLLAARLAYNIIIVLSRRPGEAGGKGLPKLLPLPFKPTRILQAFFLPQHSCASCSNPKSPKPQSPSKLKPSGDSKKGLKNKNQTQHNG